MIVWSHVDKEIAINVLLTFSCTGFFVLNIALIFLMFFLDDIHGPKFAVYKKKIILLGRKHIFVNELYRQFGHNHFGTICIQKSILRVKNVGFEVEQYSISKNNH